MDMLYTCTYISICKDTYVYTCIYVYTQTNIIDINIYVYVRISLPSFFVYCMVLSRFNGIVHEVGPLLGFLWSIFYRTVVVWIPLP